MAEKRQASEEENQEEEPAEAKAEAKPEAKQEARRFERDRPEHSKEGGQATFRREPKARKDDNVVFVGKKPTMSYVLAVITQFSDGNNEVFVKARGRSISTVIDVVEVVKKKFMQDLKCEIETDTEVITDERNQRINVSTLSARLYK
jgi:DNA-binding protein